MMLLALIGPSSLLLASVMLENGNGWAHHYYAHLFERFNCSPLIC
jgi:hypothetical protein